MIKYLKTEEFGDLPVRIGYSALKRYKEKTDKSLMDKDGLDNMMSGDLEYLLFYSLQSGFRATKQKMELEFSDMEFVLDECMFDFVKMIPAFFPKDDSKKKEDKTIEEKK